MKTGAVVAIIIIVVIAVALVWWIYQANSGYQAVNPYPTSTVGSETSTPGGPMLPAFDQSISDGAISLNYPSADFGLATTPQQILVQSTIPPCSATFNDCLYYNNSSTYAGTNFESAGIRIQKRPGLVTQSQCLNTEPTGYTALTPTIATSSDYAVSAFPGIGGGAAGQLSSGAVYRLYYEPNGAAGAGSACYELETRIGQSDYANYPSGSIQQFTGAQQSTLESELQAILGTLTIASSGEQIVFP